MIVLCIFDVLNFERPILIRDPHCPLLRPVTPMLVVMKIAKILLDMPIMHMLRKIRLSGLHLVSEKIGLKVCCNCVETSTPNILLCSLSACVDLY